MRKYKVKTAFCWMYHANIIGSLCKFLNPSVKVIWNVRHSLDDFKGEKFSTKLAIFLGRFLSFKVEKVIFCALPSLKQHLRINYCSSEKAVYIPNGFDFKVDIENRNLTKKRNKIIIGAAGRFHPSKDYPTLFKALKILQDNAKPFELRIIGNGISLENKDLINLINKIGLNFDNIKLLGFTDDTYQFYRELDLFVLASKTEGFPNVLVEALYSGCYCVCSNTGDVKQIILSQDQIFEVGNQNMLVNKILDYSDLDLESIKNIRIENSIHVFNNFHISKFNKRLLSIANGK